MRASICNFRRLGGSVRRRRMVARFGGRCFGSGIRMAIRNEQAATAKRRHRESDSGPSSGGSGGRVKEILAHAVEQLCGDEVGGEHTWGAPGAMGGEEGGVCQAV